MCAAYVFITWIWESLVFTINCVDIQCKEGAKSCYKPLSLFIEFVFVPSLFLVGFLTFSALKSLRVLLLSFSLSSLVK